MQQQKIHYSIGLSTSQPYAWLSEKQSNNNALGQFFVLFCFLFVFCILNFFFNHLHILKGLGEAGEHYCPDYT